jgi:hypothetical protein
MQNIIAHTHDPHFYTVRPFPKVSRMNIEFI